MWLLFGRPKMTEVPDGRYGRISRWCRIAPSKRAPVMLTGCGGMPRKPGKEDGTKVVKSTAVRRVFPESMRENKRASEAVSQRF